MSDLPPLDPATLPTGIRSRFIEAINGLRMHILEAGEPGRPCVLLLHGFPELAYSWRKVMLPLAEAGYMWSRPTSAATAAPPAGAPITTATSRPSGCSTWCGMRWGCWRRSARLRWRRWLGMISARRSPPGARCCGRTCSAPSP